MSLPGSQLRARVQRLARRGRHAMRQAFTSPHSLCNDSIRRSARLTAYPQVVSATVGGSVTWWAQVQLTSAKVNGLTSTQTGSGDTVSVVPLRPLGRMHLADEIDPAQLRAAAPVLQPLWAVRYRIALITLDLCCIIIATIFGFELRFGVSHDNRTTMAYLITGAVIALGWIVALQASGGYEIRHLATGPEEA